MSPPFHPPRTPEPDLSPTALRAAKITGRLLVALMFFALGMALMSIGVELIRADASAFATWRTGAGVLVMFITGGAYEATWLYLKRAFRP